MAAAKSIPPPDGAARDLSAEVFAGQRREGATREAPPTLLLTVGVDAATHGMLLRAAGREEAYRTDQRPDITSARTAVDAYGKPTIVVIEAAHLHTRLTFPAFAHVIALAGPDRSAPRAFGADEVIRRPFQVDEVRTRLQLAARALWRDYEVPPGEALRDILRGERTGEVIIKRGDDLARVHVDHGKVAWVHRPKHAVSISGLLAAIGVAQSDQTAREIVEESRRTRRHFGEVIVEWGIAERARVRECFRAHIAGELRAVLEWGGATTTFVEEKRASSSSFAFAPAEVLPKFPSAQMAAVVADGSALAAQAQPAEQALVEQWLDRMEQVPHVLGCALLDTRVGVVLGSRGTLSRNMDAAWEMAGGFSSLGPDGEEVLATTRTAAYLVRTARPTLPAVAVVTFDPTQLSVAMARIVVSRAAASVSTP